MEGGVAGWVVEMMVLVAGEAAEAEEDVAGDGATECPEAEMVARATEGWQVAAGSLVVAG